ncbi:MAG: response regulator [Deltaproteobacteria bacterium]|nr:response regulator [Deltaproteobacteria bacterium]
MTKRVLVGESNYAEFEVLSDLLTAKGLKVTWLKNGRDVVAQYDQIRPHLMILDALLPGMTGLKVTQAVKNGASGSDVRVILMSSVYRQFKQQYEQRTKYGVDAYTDKPVNVAEIERLIDELLGEIPGEDAAAETVVDAFAESAPTAPRVAAVSETPREIVPPPAIREQVRPAEEPSRRGFVEGSLAETPFPKLLFTLFKYKRTGALRVDREKVSKVIYFRDGMPVFVTSNQSNDSLGRFLVARHFISVAQYNASLEKMIDSGKGHGEVLLGMGAITPHDLYRGLQEHIFDKVLSVFSWDYGQYRFRPGRFDLDQNIAVQIEPLRLIYQGVRRFYPLTRLETFFNDYKNRRLHIKADGQVHATAAGLLPSEMKFTTLINGKRSVGQIVARSNLSLTETFQVLYVLILVEAIRFRGDPDFGARTAETQKAFEKDRRDRRAEMREQDTRRRKYAAEVERAYGALDRQTHYERLALRKDATTDAIKAAYFRLSQRYRDHRLYGAADEATRRMADELFDALTEAYEVLLTPDRRREYDASVARGVFEIPVEPPRPATPVAEDLDAMLTTISDDEFRKPAMAGGFDEFFAEAPEPKPEIATEERAAKPLPEAEPAPVAATSFDEDLEAALWEIDAELSKPSADDEREVNIFEGDAGIAESEAVTFDMGNLLKAELAFQEGEDALRDGDFAEAARAFAEALRVAPNEAEYHASFGWATFSAAPDDDTAVATARESLDRAVGMNPGLDMAIHYQGMMARHARDTVRAKSLFERALQLNPDNEAAAKALRDLDRG